MAKGRRKNEEIVKKNDVIKCAHTIFFTLRNYTYLKFIKMMFGCPTMKKTFNILVQQQRTQIIKYINDDKQKESHLRLISKQLIEEFNEVEKNE